MFPGLTLLLFSAYLLVAKHPCVVVIVVVVVIFVVVVVAVVVVVVVVVVLFVDFGVFSSIYQVLFTPHCN